MTRLPLNAILGLKRIIEELRVSYKAKVIKVFYYCFFYTYLIILITIVIAFSDRDLRSLSHQ